MARDRGTQLLNPAFARKAFASLGDDTTLSRFVKVKHSGPRKHKQHVLNGMGHPTIEAGRSIFFRKGVKAPDEVGNVLVSGHSNVKIGRDVRKGRLFRGYWIYTLTLEERATCPRSCVHWYDCYGNNMPFAKRIEEGPKLLEAIERDIERLLSVRGRAGILVRLHALGDFYSVAYVAFWARMLEVHPNLACFGYTARIDGAIGDQIRMVRKRFGKRFAIRQSEGKGSTWNTVSVISPTEAWVRNAIPCPEQTGSTQCCATCGLCWNSERTIAFTDH